MELGASNAQGPPSRGSARFRLGGAFRVADTVEAGDHRAMRAMRCPPTEPRTIFATFSPKMAYSIRSQSTFRGVPSSDSWRSASRPWFLPMSETVAKRFEPRRINTVPLAQKNSIGQWWDQDEIRKFGHMALIPLEKQNNLRCADVSRDISRGSSRKRGPACAR